MISYTKIVFAIDHLGPRPAAAAWSEPRVMSGRWAAKCYVSVAEMTQGAGGIPPVYQYVA
jgi:hypothetical protein